MKDSKLVRYLQKLTDQERREFEKTIGNKTLLQLYQLVVAAHPHYEGLAEEVLAKKIKNKKGKTLSVTDVQSNASRLASLIKDYWALQAWHTQPYLRERSTISAYAQRGCYKEFAEDTQALIDAIEGKPAKGAEEFYTLYKLYKDFHFHSYTNTFTSDAIYLDKAQEYLEKFYLLEKLKMITENIHRQRIFTIHHKATDATTLPAVPEHYKEPVFQLYLNLIQILQQQVPNELTHNAPFQLRQNITYLCKEDNVLIISMLIYYANHLYEHGHFEFLNYVFDLYHIADQENYICNNNAVSHHVYMNVTATAAGLGKDKEEWADYFVKKYQPFLDPAIADHAYHFAMATCYFFKEAYEEAQFHLIRLLYDDIPLRLQAEMLYLRIYYELITKRKAKEEDFNKCVERLLKYFERNAHLIPFSESRETAILNFINFTKKLIHYHKRKHHKAELKKALAEELQALPQVFSRGWLHQKVKELK